MAESKKEIYDILPRGKYPTTILAIENQPFEKIILQIFLLPWCKLVKGSLQFYFLLLF